MLNIIFIWFYLCRKTRINQCFIWYNICHPHEESFHFLLPCVIFSGQYTFSTQYEIWVCRLLLSSYHPLNAIHWPHCIMTDSRILSKNFPRKIKNMADLPHRLYLTCTPWAPSTASILFFAHYILWRNTWHGVLKQGAPYSSAEENSTDTGVTC